MTTRNGTKRESESPLLPGGPEQLEKFCREVSEPITFALTRLIDARQKVELCTTARDAARSDALNALGAARSGIEHAARLIAELYVCLRTRDETERLELARLVESVLELLDPELRDRVVVRRDHRPATPVVNRRGMLARALMTLLLDVLGRTYSDQPLADGERAQSPVGYDEVFDVRRGPSDSQTAVTQETSARGLDSWALIFGAHGGQVGIEPSPDGGAKVCLHCPGSEPPQR